MIAEISLSEIGRAIPAGVSGAATAQLVEELMRNDHRLADRCRKMQSKREFLGW